MLCGKRDDSKECIFETPDDFIFVLDSESFKAPHSETLLQYRWHLWQLNLVQSWYWFWAGLFSVNFLHNQTILSYSWRLMMSQPNWKLCLQNVYICLENINLFNRSYYLWKEYKRNVKNYRIKIRSWELLNLICHMAMNTVQKSEVERYKREILKNKQDRTS